MHESSTLAATASIENFSQKIELSIVFKIEYAWLSISSTMGTTWDGQKYCQFDSNFMLVLSQLMPLH